MKREREFRFVCVLGCALVVMALMVMACGGGKGECVSIGTLQTSAAVAEPGQWPAMAVIVTQTRVPFCEKPTTLTAMAMRAEEQFMATPLP